MAEIDTGTVNTVDTPADFGKGDQGTLRRWLVELRLAKKRMEQWQNAGRKLWALYHGKRTGGAQSSYNILYANTEILAPAVYNSLPTPDTRRRFGDADPIGRAVSEVIDRTLSFNLDSTEFDTEIRADVLDMLIVGRGISRVRHIPNLVQVGDLDQTGRESDETEMEHEAQEGEQNEELEWETAPIEHVAWDMYLCGPGRTFKEIPWWAFKHNLTRDEAIDRFGEEKGRDLPLNGKPAGSELDNVTDSDTLALFKTAEVWEIWDKDTRTVVWVCEQWQKGPLEVEDDPLELERFFPVVDPLRAIEDSDTFDPTPLYDQYRKQAKELDKITARIDRLVDACKARGLYDASLGDQITELFRAADNDLVPASKDIKAIYQAGGSIEKAIWFAPIERIVEVIKVLYDQREQCKAVIFELTGIADIMRGATDANETYGAQALKTQFGMTRLQRLQRAVQRYIRDLMRLQAEVICKKFSLDTLKQMTALPYPTDAQVGAQRIQMMMQAIAQRMQGQQVPPIQFPPRPVTWEVVYAALQSDTMRTFKVDIETDSTIAAVQQEEAGDLQAVLSALVELVKEIGPMVQQGVMPFEAFKQLLLMVCRKFRMGASVEDAIDAMQPPQQGQPPVQVQVEQMRQQGKQQEIAANLQADRERAQLDAQTAYLEQHAQALQSQQENALEQQRNQLQAQNEAALERMRMATDAALDRMKGEMQAQLQVILQAMKGQSAIEVAEITTGAQLEAAQISAARTAAGENQ